MNQPNQQQDVAIFNNPLFGDVEVLNLNGKFYFPATKVATILGYSNPRDAISRHCVTDIPYVVKHDVGVQTGIKADGSPAIQMVSYTFINEGNLYILITKSKLPLAQQFERWVFDEVLPTIRQTGGIYMTDTMWEYLCSKPEMWGQILLDYGQLKNKWEEAQPKLERYDTFMESNYGYNMATASKILKFQAPQRKQKIIGRNQLFQILRDLNILQSTTQINNDDKIKIFSNDIFGDMLVLDINNKPYFPAHFISGLLESDIRAIINVCIIEEPHVVRHDMRYQTGVKELNEPIVIQIPTLFIDDENIRRLISHSTANKKEELEKWVFEGIIPSFKKN